MNVIDKLYEVFKPSVALKRERDRVALGMLREYAAARPNRLSNGLARRKSRASDEVGKAHGILAAGGQELVRDTALGNRIKAVIASNIVGTGIRPDYIGGAKRTTAKYKTTFDDWAESTACDYEGHHNLYGLQWLWAATVVESGGCFVRRIMNNALAFPLVLQTLEQQFLDEAKSGQTENGGEIVNGIQYDEQGLIEGYWLKTRITGYRHWEQSKFYSAADVVHIYRKDRAGQHLGVSWYHPVGDLVHDRQEWRDAALTQQRIAACFGIIIKEPESTMGLGEGKSNGLRDEDGNAYTEMEPGMVAYAGKGTEVETVTPPKLDGNGQFNSEVVQDIAVGTGVTREQLTGDFSKVTWASGRLARGEFYTNLDRWQQFMMLPALNKIHDWFDDIYTVKYGRVSVKRSWIWPHRSAVNPKEELEVDIMKVRSGAMTPQQFTRKHGVKFEDMLEAWKEAKRIMGDLPFDFDPSKFSSAGNQLDNNDSASSNAEPKKPEKADEE